MNEIEQEHVDATLEYSERTAEVLDTRGRSLDNLGPEQVLDPGELARFAAAATRQELADEKWSRQITGAHAG